MSRYNRRPTGFNDYEQYDKILEKRLLKRSKKDKRSDDMPSIIKKRQKI